jgi:hypothetical protein
MGFFEEVGRHKSEATILLLTVLAYVGFIGVFFSKWKDNVSAESRGTAIMSLVAMLSFGVLVARLPVGAQKAAREAVDENQDKQY